MRRGETRTGSRLGEGVSCTSPDSAEFARILPPQVSKPEGADLLQNPGGATEQLAGCAGRNPERLARLDVLASWGAALRSRAAGSQDELRCSAIHKQRPYRGWREEAGRGNGGRFANRPYRKCVSFWA